MSVNNQHGRNGRLILEDGSMINQADILLFERTYNPFYQTVNNGATIISTRFTHTFTALSTYTFALEVPEGRTLTLFSRLLSLSSGEYYIDVLTGDSHTGGTTNDIAYETLRDASSSAIESVLRRGVTVTNPSVIEYGYTNTGGDKKTESALGESDVIKQFTNDTYLQITSVAGGESTINLVLLCWEE